MRQLELPTVKMDELLTLCFNEVSDAAQKNRYEGNRIVIQGAAILFDAATDTTSWCELARVPKGHSDEVVIGDLTKSELTSLYTDYLVGSKGAARRMYDQIKASANGKCPFCGGIGHVRTLDHYLPKAHFPQYAVLPSNLVPCCRDCNTEKHGEFTKSRDHQPLHPYLDKSEYFNQKWTTATVIRTEPIVISFSANPPPNWPQEYQNRVKSHFEDYDLAIRYGTEAAVEIAILLDQRRSGLHHFSSDAFRSHLLDIANSNSMPVNGWKRTMYFSLANTEWFCNADFRSPTGYLAI
jgi:hypothetical protein